MSPKDDQYDIEETDIGKARLKTLKLMIIHTQEESERRHAEVMEALGKIVKHQEVQDTVSSNLESGIASIRESVRLWVWFSAKPLRIALFFGIIFVGVKVLSSEKAWGYIEKLLKLL